MLFMPGIRVSLELLSLTQLGAAIGNKPKGMPRYSSSTNSVKGEGRPSWLSELLKDWPKLLKKFVPGQKVQDLRNWLSSTAGMLGIR